MLLHYSNKFLDKINKVIDVHFINYNSAGNRIQCKPCKFVKKDVYDLQLVTFQLTNIISW